MYQYLLISKALQRNIKKAYASSTIRMISGVAGGNLLATLLAIVGSLVQARFVSPSDLGYFRGFSIATNYAFFLHLGLWDALHRLYPYYIGKGQREHAIATAEICQAWNIAVSVIVSGIFLFLAIISLFMGNWRAMLGWLVQAIGFAGIIYGGHLSATYRSGHDFNTYAKSSVIASVISLFSLPLFIFWPYVALVLRSSIGNFVSLIYLHIHRPLKLGWRFTWKEWFDLVKQGLPILSASYGAGTGLSAVQATIVLSFLGTSSLGFLSISLMLFESAKQLSQAITAVYIPRVTEVFGRTESVHECMKLMRKPMWWGTIVSLSMTIGLWLMLPIIVPVLMPKYVEAIPAMCLTMLLLPIMIFELPYSLLVAMGKKLEQNIAAYAGLLGFVLLSVFAIKLGFGLNGVIIATLGGRIIRLLLTYRFIYSTRRYHVTAT